MVVKRSQLGDVGTEGRSRARRESGGLVFEPVFCPQEVSDPYETVTWDERTAAIRSESGAILFEQKGCQFPESWSQLAVNVVASKYFYGEVGTPQRETSIRQLIDRVADTIAAWGAESSVFATEADRTVFYRDLAWLLLHQYGSFNSPVWFNVGIHEKLGLSGGRGAYCWSAEQGRVVQAPSAYSFPQVSACFIQSVQDDMDSIMTLAVSEAMLFKFGSGTGTDLSPLRSFREKLSGGGKPSGPLSFMRVYDQIAAVVKSGGKTRRAAKMQSLKVSHPDIFEFIEAKRSEETKAQALIRQGYDANFNGEAYGSVLFQNANFSVRVTDAFMQAVEADDDWHTHWVTEPSREGPKYKARLLMEKMAKGTWQCGDPGLQYDSTINAWHTCPNSGRINASNPCSEYMFLDDSACNLASLNLMKFRSQDGSFNVERFRQAARVFITAQEILVDRAGYPMAEIAKNSHDYRPLGLGYTNFGALLMASGLPYNSREGRSLCGALTAIMTGQAYLTSSEIAGIPAPEGDSGVIGPFPGFAANREPMLRVMEKHRAAVEAIDPVCSAELLGAARQVWDDCLENGRRAGYRNAQATVLAPTGTISFMMDCDTTGIEPDLALVKYKQLAGGGMLKIVNQTVPLALQTLDYSSDEQSEILAFIEANDTVEGCPQLKDEHLGVFDCAFKPKNGERAISWKAHVKMMAAAQPFLSGAISKTVNMPCDSSVEDIVQAYFEGWRLGLKALAIYRDGSKESQPLSTSTESEKEASAAANGEHRKPFRKHLPDTRASVTHKFSVNGHEGYVTVGLYEDGRPGELFITMAKEGSTIGGLMDVLGTVVSMSLQYGVPLEVLVGKFSHSRFEPSGWTSNPDIPMAKSIVDYIFRWLGIQFIPGFREENTPHRPNAAAEKEDLEGDEGKTKGDSLSAEPGSCDSASFESSPSDSSSTGSEGDGNGHPALSVQPEELARLQSEAVLCDHCGALTVRVGMCYLCYNCGNTSGCG